MTAAHVGLMAVACRQGASGQKSAHAEPQICLRQEQSSRQVPQPPPTWRQPVNPLVFSNVCETKARFRAVASASLPALM